MNPVNFEDANCVYKAEGCGDLPALKTGKIYLLVMGQAQPPVALYIDRPYIRQ